jgi:hypothetical protein
MRVQPKEPFYVQFAPEMTAVSAITAYHAAGEDELDDDDDVVDEDEVDEDDEDLDEVEGEDDDDEFDEELEEEEDS